MIRAITSLSQLCATADRSCIFSRETGSLLIISGCGDDLDGSQSPLVEMIQSLGGCRREGRKMRIIWFPPSLGRDGSAFPFGYAKMSPFIAFVDTGFYKA